AFEQQRPLEEIHQPQRSRDVAVGDIADGGEFVRDLVAGEAHRRLDNMCREDYDRVERHACLPSPGGGGSAASVSEPPGWGERRTPAFAYLLALRAIHPTPLASLATLPLHGRVRGAHPCSPSCSAAVQVRQWSCGIWIWVEPRNAKASLIAFEKH